MIGVPNKGNRRYKQEKKIFSFFYFGLLYEFLQNTFFLNISQNNGQENVKFRLYIRQHIHAKKSLLAVSGNSILR